MQNIRAIQALMDRALRHYSVLAVQAGRRFELALCHGAVCTVASRSFDPQCEEVVPNECRVELVASVAGALRLRPDWVESDGALYIASASAQHSLQSDGFAPGLILSVNSGARILAHKLHLLGSPLSPGATDAHDAEFLLHKIHLTSPAQVDRIYARYYPGGGLSARARQLIASALQPKTASRQSP